MKVMKDSGIAWIGEIPKEWEVGTIGMFFDEINNPNTNQEETNTLQFKMGDIISKKYGDSKYNPETIAAYNVVEPGTIMINGLNLSFDLVSQRVAQVHERGAITSTYLAMMPKNGLQSNFAKYMLKSYDNCKALHSMGRGLRATLSYSTFRTEPIFLPPLPEQQSIANYLDSKCAEIDELVALQDKMIDELKAYKQSVITEAVTKGLDSNAKMKDSGVEWIGEIPEGWEVVPFKSIYSLGKGLSITKADLVDTGVPVISYGQIHSKLNKGTYISDELIRYVPTSFLTDNDNSLVKEGDLIFADTSEDLEGCGNCVYIDRADTLFSGYHTIIARNKTNVKNNYISYLIKTDCWRMQLRSVVNGVKLFSIPQKTLATTSLIVPSIEEQQSIANYLDTKCSEIDALIAIKQKKIEELKEYKKSLIYECVTGKKELI